MKKVHLKSLLFMAIGSMVVSFSAVIMAKGEKNNHLEASVEQEVWNHYSMVAPTETERGIKEYWVSCSSHSYSFFAPKSGIVYDKGAPSLEFINSLGENDNRLYLPYGNYLYFSFNYDDDSLDYYQVSLSNSSYSKEVYIPMTYQGLPVKRIRGSGFSYGKIQSIIIPEGITTIGYDAFGSCQSLSVIILPSTLSFIESDAFSGCRLLQYVLYRGNQSQWNSISIFNSGNDPLVNAAKHYTYTGTLKHINDGNFKYVLDDANRVYALKSLNSRITSFVFGELFPLKTLVSIDNYCFQYHTYLTSVALSSNIKAIGENTFNYCIGLTSIIIPENVNFIGYNAFWNCSKLTIYCRAASKPSGWHNDWNGENRPVVWGYTGS